ncbi:MAG: single-stranded-DNA-specific exonuclease RecJ, partial [Flavobacteriales bacterium]
MKKRWAEISSPPAAVVERLASDLKIDKKLASLLVNRGITTFEEAHTWFRPSLEHLHAPLLMKDMHRAVVRLQAALAQEEKILVYGDYDVDGTTAVALVYKFLKTMCNHIDFYIPDRYAEGYGISFQGIDYAKENGFTLIIALDCGIKANDKVDYAKSKGIDFIICDHHLPGEKLPDAIVLDPKRADCPYPYKELSGCGIGFKFMQAFAEANQVPFESLLDFIDLVAVSTASDIVPITGENRILTYHGLLKINENPSRGIGTILSVSGKKSPLTVSNLVFIVGPRINAAGRMTTGKHAVELLIADDEKSSVEFAALLNDINQERRTVDQQLTAQALEMIGSDENMRNAKTTVLYNPEWHKGVIGIVASRLTETYYRPTILFGGGNARPDEPVGRGKATGSARSVEGFDVHAAIEKCADLLEQFGGHKYAAGLTIKPENIPAFAKKFEKVVAASIEPHMLIPSIIVDQTLEDFSLLRSTNTEPLPKFYRVLKQMEPFGPHNQIPVFMTKNLKAAYPPRLLTGNHLKLTVCQAENPELKIDAIGFGLGDFCEPILSGAGFDMVYSVEENEWNGK